MIDNKYIPASDLAKLKAAPPPPKIQFNIHLRIPDIPKVSLPVIWFTIILLGIILGLLLVQQEQDLRSQAAPSTSLSLIPQTTTPKIGETFITSIDINTGNNHVIIAEIYLSFDQNMLEAIDISPGDFFSSAEIPGKSIDNQSGKIEYIINIPPENRLPVQGTGTLAHITFKSLNTGSTQISFDTDPNSETIVGAIGERENAVLYTISTLVDIQPLTTPTPAPICNSPNTCTIVTIIPGSKITCPDGSNPLPDTCTLLGTPNMENICCPPPTSTPTPTPQSLIPGDINSDGAVNSLDYVILFENFGQEPPTDPAADINDDGAVNSLDYVILFENYGKTIYTPTPTPPPNDKQQACQLDPLGQWQQFPNSCVDYCTKIINPLCLTVLTMGCDCGPYHCWTETQCIPSTQ